MSSDETHAQDVPFRDAERWLAARGVAREPIRIPTQPDADDDRTPVQAREAVRLATEAPPAGPPPAATGESSDEEASDEEADAPTRPPLEDAVRSAVATCQRITAQAPQSEQRLRAKLEQRDVPRPVIDLALDRCRELGVVDDLAMATALAAERRSKGHAVSRVRRDLSQRGFPDAVLDQVLADAEREDPEAAAFATARQRAPRLRRLEPETAFRRLAGYLMRRGYPDGLSRKVARDVVYADREQQRVAER